MSVSIYFCGSFFKKQEWELLPKLSKVENLLKEKSVQKREKMWSIWTAKMFFKIFLKSREAHYILVSNHYWDETGEKKHLTFQMSAHKKSQES